MTGGHLIDPRQSPKPLYPVSAFTKLNDDDRKGDRMDANSSRISIVMANMPGLVAEVLEQWVRCQLDMRIVARVSTYLELPSVLNTSVDVVLLGSEHLFPLPSIASYLLEKYPHLHVLALSNNGDEGVGFRLELQHQRLYPLSGDSLISHIRQFSRHNPI